MKNFITCSQEEERLVCFAEPGPSREGSERPDPFLGCRRVLGTAPSDLTPFLCSSRLFGIFFNCFTSEASSSSGDSRACSRLSGHSQVQACTLSTADTCSFRGRPRPSPRFWLDGRCTRSPRRGRPRRPGAQDFWSLHTRAV